MTSVTLAHCAAGGNRHPSAADWAPGLLAFGAGHNLALWNPEDPSNRGIYALLAGHSDTINAVKIFDRAASRHIITGGGDKTIRIWKLVTEPSIFEQSQCLDKHHGSINTIAAIPASSIFVSGSADGTVKVWSFDGDQVKLLQSLTLKPHYLPLTCSLLDSENGQILLAVGGTSTSVQLFFRDGESTDFVQQATLTGHESWIRSLDFSLENNIGNSDVLLASASQDKFIRLWRVRRSTSSTPAVKDNTSNPVISTAGPLSNKAHRIGSIVNSYSITFEALLVGHEDWIYTVRWAPPQSNRESLTLLSASADNSLSLWQADESSNVWICRTRLGEISAQKGSTTATGSTGGFWIGLWQPDGQAVASLGRTGSWRRWSYNTREGSWLQQVGISGHTKEAQSCTWAPDGSYLLSTCSDQTTRMLAEWKRENTTSWHEFARPQIHGYDLNCITSTGANQFVSGADEKLLRVFRKPKAIDLLLNRLSGTKSSIVDDLPDAANIPVLGLSNKAVNAEGTQSGIDDSMENGTEEEGELNTPALPSKHTLDLNHPPLEEHLARHTLWPEHEKLYGHGYEISTVASTHDGSLIATACKASSLDHAVIRLYDCRDWREIKPPLTAHSLTVTSLAFSPDDRYLLSVSRDRGWFVFERDGNNSKNYKVLCSNPKAHSRMILDCVWAPQQAGNIFATAGRDKTVKVWKFTDGKVNILHSMTANAAVTAVSFDQSDSPDVLRLAYGTEDGIICITDISVPDMSQLSMTSIERSIRPSATVNTLSWRPGARQLAAGSDDTSVRIFELSVG